MKRSCIGAVLSLLTALPFLMPAALKADLDLSPSSTTYELDGIVMPQLSFNNGSSNHTTYDPPHDWKYSGGRDYLDLQPAGVTQAKARIAKWAIEPQVTFAGDGLGQLKQRILASLPEGSANVEVISEEANPLQIGGKQTYLIELSYTYYGEKYGCYCLVLDRKPEPISFRLSCRETDYQKLRPAFHRSLFSWQNL